MFFGIEMRSEEILKINSQRACMEVVHKGTRYEFFNREGNRLKDLLRNEGIYVNYFDYEKSTEVIKFLGQSNLPELLEQYDDYVLQSDSVKELSYIVGKDYDNCTVTEIEDDENIIPYFKVK